jgi:hypothetical protein
LRPALIFIYLLFSGVIWPQSTGTTESVPDYLVIAGSATNVKHIRAHGQDQVVYNVEAAYPASDVLKTINGRLERLGWIPLKEDFLNPGTPTSHVRGWQYFGDNSTEPRTSVRSWVSDWENTNHDILVYLLEYRCKDDLCSNTENLHYLRVVAVYVPSALAQQLKDAAIRNSSK